MVAFYKLSGRRVPSHPDTIFVTAAEVAESILAAADTLNTECARIIALMVTAHDTVKPRILCEHEDTPHTTRINNAMISLRKMGGGTRRQGTRRQTDGKCTESDAKQNGMFRFAKRARRMVDHDYFTFEINLNVEELTAEQFFRNVEHAKDFKMTPGRAYLSEFVPNVTKLIALMQDQLRYCSFLKFRNPEHLWCRDGREDWWFLMGVLPTQQTICVLFNFFEEQENKVHPES